MYLIVGPSRWTGPDWSFQQYIPLNHPFLFHFLQKPLTLNNQVIETACL